MMIISRCNSVAHAWLTYWRTWLSCSLEDNIITCGSFKEVTELQSARPGADDNVVMINIRWWARCHHHQQQQPWCCILHLQQHRCRFVNLRQFTHDMLLQAMSHSLWYGAFSPPNQFAPWNFRFLELSFPGTFAPGTFAPRSWLARELALTWNFRSQEYSLPRTSLSWTSSQRSTHSLKSWLTPHTLPIPPLIWQMSLVGCFLYGFVVNVRV